MTKIAKEDFLEEIEKRMEESLKSFKNSAMSLRTGRASASLLDRVMVDVYGQMTPIQQVGTITVPEARMLCIQVWDRGIIIAVEKAICTSGLGINPVVDGTIIRLPIPPLTKERRLELSKMAAKYAESARVAIRNIRKNYMDKLKEEEKKKLISEDEKKRLAEHLQVLTNKIIKLVDEALEQKEKDIMQ